MYIKFYSFSKYFKVDIYIGKYYNIEQLNINKIIEVLNANSMVPGIYVLP